MNGISLPLILFGSIAVGILILTVYVAIYHLRKGLISRIFSIIKEKSLENKPTREEADAVIGILYTNNVEVASPIFLFVNENHATNLLIVSLLRAALRYFNARIEIELDGPGITKLPGEDRKSFGQMLRAEKTIESTIDFSRITMIKKIDVLLTECSRASRTYAYLLEENGRKIPVFKPLFFIAQKTPKDPRRILFPEPLG